MMKGRREGLSVVAMALLFTLSGCLAESPNPVVFDQVIESTTFTNYLLSPVVLYRNGVILDTLPTRTTRSYDIGAKGIFRHAWKLISPRSPFGDPYGVEPFVDVGIQYNINDKIDIANSANGRTLFTPRIINASFGPVRLAWVNFRQLDERFVGLTLFANEASSVDHAPYFFWNSSSNVYIDEVNGFRIWVASRDDTTSDGDPQLRLEEPGGLGGSGLTNPLVLF